MSLSQIKNKVVPDLKREGAVKVAVFGSFSRNEAKKNSDIDLLVDFRDDKSLLDLVKLKFKLEKITGRKIDLLTYNSIHPLLKNSILREQKVIYEKRP